MDPTLLERDEFQVECDIRNVDAQDKHAAKELESYLVEETSGLRPAPSGVHSTTRTNTEVAEIHGKLSTIDPVRSAKSGNPLDLLQCHSRLMHLQARLTRFVQTVGGTEPAQRLKKDIDDALRKCILVMSGTIHQTEIEGACGGAAEDQQGQALLGLLHSGRPRSSTMDLRQNMPHTREPASRIHNTSATQDPSSSPPSSAATGHLSAAPTACANGVDADHFSRLSLGLLPPCGQHAPPPIQRQAPFMPPPSPNRAPAPGHFYPPSGANTAQGWTMSKWPLRFGGGPRDLPVDEFIFRVETLARLANIPHHALTLGLHQILSGSASTWYWIFIRREPYATWNRVKMELTGAFQSNVSDAAIRRMIMDRLQRANERFMEFAIAIQELEVRLTERMSERELLEALRRNMLPHIQDRLLFVPIDSVAQLQQRVHQVEELAQRQAEVQQYRRTAARVHEIAALPMVANEIGAAESFTQSSTADRRFVQPPEEADGRFNPFAAEVARNQVGEQGQGNEQRDWICAMETSADRNRLTICWNCDDIGHTFMDCAAPRLIFCYGCGAKNVVRPQCAKCSVRQLQGNGPRNVRPTMPQQPSTNPEGQMFRHQPPRNH